jgi:hypothetical protein
MQGFGRAVIVNGAFLMLFDLIMYQVHNRHGSLELYPWINNLDFQGTGLGLRIPLD